MAIVKQVKTDFSNTQTIFAEYFQISSLNIAEKQGLQVTYAGYVSKEDCQAGCPPIISFTTPYLGYQENKLSIHDPQLVEKIDKIMLLKSPFEGGLYDPENVVVV